MVTNPYFQVLPGNITPEQQLLEDLIIEQVQIYGMNVYYLPRENLPNTQTDLVYGENTSNIFNDAFQMEAYLDLATNFEGQHTLFNKFNLNIIDITKFVLPRRTFQKYTRGEFLRPQEGDLIYCPTMNKLFEIKFVDEDDHFFTLGRQKPLVYTYKLSVETFKYNNERFSTGVAAIDNFGINYSYTLQLYLGAGSGTYAQGETVTNGTSTATVKYYDKANSILSLITVKGEFANTANVVGQTSNANYQISTFNPKDLSGQWNQLADNLQIDTEAGNITTDTFNPLNPFNE